MRLENVILVSICLATGCASSNDEVAGPPFSPLEPPPHEGEPGGMAGWSTREEPAETGGGSAGVAGVAGVAGGAAGSPASAEICGETGGACCAEGPACTQHPEKARCCTDCGGFPGFKCKCGEDYVADGACKLCCVVCENGFTSSPQLVPEGSTCDAVASDFCAQKGGANTEKSGWKKSCQ
jgi:hypothetical protein